MNDLINVNTAASRLDVKKQTIYSWVHFRKIPFIKLGGAVKFDPQELEKWIADRKVEPLLKR